MSIYPPDKVWWKPIDREEKIWLVIALIWLSFTFFLMPVLHVYGRQNPPALSYRVTPERFEALSNEFIEKYRVLGSDGQPVAINGVPVVHPQPGGDAYIVARAWSWQPILELEKGKPYRIHLSSLDFQHGFSIYPLNMNFMAIPGEDYILRITPTSSGEFSILCNEYCGIGHHTMVGKLIVR
ncbi:MAG: cytochrome C oxidase subunit II [Deltaproteobacteria bacterium]|nr:cytochrome C oxidase subunit II [Deltaproteobacteria bacterium]